jgi:hypothetical protein
MFFFRFLSSVLSVPIWQFLQCSILNGFIVFLIFCIQERCLCTCEYMSVGTRRGMSLETKYVELCKGINGLDKIILREVRGCSAEVYFLSLSVSWFGVINETQLPFFFISLQIYCHFFYPFFWTLIGFLCFERPMLLYSGY